MFSGSSPAPRSRNRERRSQPLMCGKVQNQGQPAPGPGAGRSDGGRARTARLVNKNITRESPACQKNSSRKARLRDSIHETETISRAVFRRIEYAPSLPLSPASGCVAARWTIPLPLLLSAWRRIHHPPNPPFARGGMLLQASLFPPCEGGVGGVVWVRTNQPALANTGAWHNHPSWLSHLRVRCSLVEAFARTQPSGNRVMG